MERGELVAKLWELLEPVVESRGLELLEVEFQREARGWVLRLYIDREEGGVSLDDCTAVSREVGDLLDVKDPIEHPYHLEVSSPGLHRPLRRPKDFQKWTGHKVKIMVSGPKKKTIQGVLSGIEDEMVEIKTPMGQEKIHLREIVRARLVYEWPKGIGLKE